MKKIIMIIIVLTIGLLLITGCNIAKDYYNNNKELIRQVIETVIDAILGQLDKPVSATSEKLSLPRDSLTPNVNSLTATDLRVYLTKLRGIVQNPEFWDNVEMRVQTVLDTNRYK